MLPLVEKLSSCLRDAANRTCGCDDERGIERVAPRGGLFGDDTQVIRYECHRVGGGLKSLQLRVPRVAASTTEEHGLRKERLTPEGNQPDGVEMTGVKSPETHEAR
jgi:hypothetical protein